ncbi:MAG: hypothetical protein JO057_09865 [Chloroflexi bacterium]|nr:hypothetical protein [Chloroflexota bacterium]
MFDWNRAVRTSLIALAGSLLGTTVNAQTTQSLTQTLRLTAKPGTQSPVIIQTQPRASCVVQPAEGNERAMARFFADQNGVARFWVKPSTSGESITRLKVECNAAGVVTNHAVEVRTSDSPNSDYPAPSRTPAPSGQARRALTEKEALSLSDQELLRRGYPLPPDPQQSPEGYRLWLRAVTRQGVILDPGLMRNPYVRHDYGHTRSGNSTSNNWSGVELRGSGGPFAWVSAWWNVPSVTGESNTQTNSSTWVGIDGDNTNDLAQAGTEQDALGTGGTLVTTYRAWTELLPNQPTESVLTNLSINPGDQVFTEVWIGSAGGGPSLTAPNPFMVVCMENLTTSGGACFNYTPLAGTVVGGSEAEWIMERPSTGCDSQGNNCTLADLANFGNVAVFTTNVLARRSNSPRHGGYTSCCGNGSFLIDMSSDGTASGTTLDTVNLNGGTINFTWSAFH